MSALKVAVVGACPYPVPQGSQIYLRNTALAIETAGHEAHLVVYGHGLGEDSSGLNIHRGAKFPGARKTAAGPSFAKPILDVALVHTLRRVVSREEIDIVDAHNYEGLLVALAARKRPILYHAHNAMADELPYYFSNPDYAATLGAWLDKTFPKRADHIVAPHETLKEYLVTMGCSKDRISVIPPWIEVQDFEAAAPERKDAAVLYTGNLDDYQNVELLFPVMERVEAEVPGTQLVIATSSDRIIEEARMVHSQDFAAIRRELARDVIFACPRTSWSGYPIKLLNAMASGLAIVCCESSAHPITHQYNGLIVPDNDVEAFAASILRLMKDPYLRRNLGANARKTVEEKHVRRVAAKALGEVLALL
ncbi:MAG: glycosyltransferase family 4 protein [Candidatus Hydrogenedentes bacterium]|nr:glycosyltransferase family 4 protein [Candidatus Hydrogenedentota bacterium]